MSTVPTLLCSISQTKAEEHISATEELRIGKKRNVLLLDKSSPFLATVS
jgi:hypothetical protein